MIALVSAKGHKTSYVELQRVILSRFPIRESEWDRFRIGKGWCRRVKASEKWRGRAEENRNNKLLCLDVGSGSNPFPMADVLCDFCPERTIHRRMKKLKTEDKPFVLCDGNFLPFKNGAFNFASCYYVLEHVEDPSQFLAEIKRVAKHGYVQSPSWFNDEILYGEDMHKWVFVRRGNKLLCRPVNRKLHPLFPLGYIFHRLYRVKFWKILHAILDEKFGLFTVKYFF